MRALGATLLALALASQLQLAPVHAQQNGVDGVIRGVLLDEVTGEPIPNVVVQVLDHVERIRRSAVSDESGRFVLLRVQPGAFWLRASHVGYARTRTPPWRIEPGELLEVTVRLHPQAVLLAPLEVNARARTHSPVLAGFYERLNRRMGGTLISRAEIEERNLARVTDLLETVPGVRIEATSRSFRMITMARALPGVGGGPNACPVQIYVDGVRATRSGPVSPDEILVPGALEGVEVYRGLGTIPAEFLTPEARCGVVVFWTRRAG
jgi:hypothetical protein